VKYLKVAKGKKRSTGRVRTGKRTTRAPAGNPQNYQSHGKGCPWALKGGPRKSESGGGVPEITAWGRAYSCPQPVIEGTTHTVTGREGRRETTSKKGLLQDKVFCPC